MFLHKLPLLGKWFPEASLSWRQDVVYLIGLLVSWYVLVSLLSAGFNLIQWFVRGGINVKKLGKWAVVTGSTDGIGKAYAFELAAKGMDVILISRTQSKLDTVKGEISEKFPNVAVKTIAVDFSKFDKNAAEKLEKELEGLEIGVLVNNVGVGYDHPEYFSAVSKDDIWNLMQVNMIPVTILTRIVLPGMEQRRRGAIINISSTSAYFPTGLLTVYSAAKAYVDFFSRALQQEVASKGILVQSVLPGFVTTKLSKIRKPSVTTPTPRLYVKQALASLGSSSEARTAGYWSHWLTDKIIGIVPQAILDKFVWNMHVDIRKRALRKKERAM